MKIGLQVSSLKKYLNTAQDVLTTFQKIKAIGYNYIQIEWIGDDVPIESVKESMDLSGLVCVGTQYAFTDILSRTDEIIAKNNLWQGRYISGALSISKEKSKIMELAAKINEVSKKISDKGMTLEIHPIFQSFVAIESTTPLDMLWEHLDNDILLQPDFYHVIRGKADPVALIEKYSGRIIEAHFKDFIIPDSNLDTTQTNNFDPLKQGVFPLTPVGQGVVPYKDIIKACITHDVKYCWAEQESWDKDAFECMRESFDFLANMGLDTR